MDAYVRLWNCLTRWGVVAEIFCLRIHMRVHVCVYVCDVHTSLYVRVTDDWWLGHLSKNSAPVFWTFSPAQSDVLHHTRLPLVFYIFHTIRVEQAELVIIFVIKFVMSCWAGGSTPMCIWSIMVWPASTPTLCRQVEVVLTQPVTAPSRLLNLTPIFSTHASAMSPAIYGANRHGALLPLAPWCGPNHVGPHTNVTTIHQATLSCFEDCCPNLVLIDCTQSPAHSDFSILNVACFLKNLWLSGHGWNCSRPDRFVPIWTDWHHILYFCFDPGITSSIFVLTPSSIFFLMGTAALYRVCSTGLR